MKFDGHPHIAPQPLSCSPVMASNEETVQCSQCGKILKHSGIGNHRRACKAKIESAAQDARLRAKLLAAPQKRELYVLKMSIHVIAVGPGSLPAPRFTSPWEKATHTGGSPVDDADVQGYAH